MFERDESGSGTTLARSGRTVSTNRAPRIRKVISAGPRAAEPLEPNPLASEHAGSGHDDQAPTTTAHANASDNERFAQRKPTKKRALIFGAGDREGTPCLVRDMSTTGVQIEMPCDQASVSRAGDFVPPRFRLQIPVERTEVDCEMAWRQGSRIGARFTSAPRMLPAPERRKDNGRGDKAGARSGGGQLLDRLFKR